VVADATGIYWTTDTGDLMGLPAGQSTPRTLRQASATPIFSLASNTAYLYFLQSDDSGRRRMIRIRRDGSQEQTLFSNLSSAAVFALDGPAVSVANSPNPGDISLGDSETLGSPQHLATSRITELALDGGELYWLTESGSLQKAASVSSGAETLIEGQTQLHDLHVISGTAFALSDYGVLARSPSDACARVLVQPMWTMSFVGLAVDAQYVYFGSLMSSDLRYSSVWRTPHQGGIATHLTAASGQTGVGPAWPLLVEPTRLIWRTEKFINALDLLGADDGTP
jgi:hypothetical protein